MENDITKLFDEIDEPYASGYFEEPEKSPFYRFALAEKRFLENMVLPEYKGGSLYPEGRKCPHPYAVFPDFSYTVGCNYNYLNEKSHKAADHIKVLYDRKLIDPRHAVAGNGFTHSIPNYERIAREGLDSYKERAEKLPDSDFRSGILLVIEGIRAYHERAISYLSSLERTEKLDRIIDSLKRVPFKPCENIFDALMSRNFIFYMDFCDNPGRIDSDLYEFYKGEDITSELADYFDNVDINDSWSGAIGPVYNPVTYMCLKAIKGKRRPSLELRVTPDMPDDLWDLACKSIETSCGNPSFYNEDLYMKRLSEEFPEIPKDDLLKFNGGGCTETMLEGVCNVGSLDAGINTALILSDLLRSGMNGISSYDELKESLYSEIKKTLLRIMDEISEMQKDREKKYPNPMRSLLIDDCIDKNTDYNSGGARYYWSIINLAGTVNVIDSLCVIKDVVFTKKLMSFEDFMIRLYSDDPTLRSLAKSSPCYGVDDDAADEVAKEFFDRVFSFYKEKTPYLGGKFIPALIQFNSYTYAGEGIPATPDGRRSGEPLCDSVGAIYGKDSKGPTALLNSVSKVDFSRAIGTPVLNLSLQKDFVSKGLRSLVMGFFEKGGMQIQVSCFSKADLIDAIDHPERHENLIVRVGGYTEYYNRLSLDIKMCVLKRCSHGE